MAPISSNLTLSVIIPTHARPEFLPRAIESALHSANADEVEVIVVPNGPDTSWESVANTFAHDSRVRWEPIPTPHANAARNHGLRLARGRYVRFLDDDDYLCPHSCRAQLQTAQATGADLVSGNVDVVDDSGRIIRRLQQPSTDDFVAGTLSPLRRSQQGAHLYRRESVHHLRWDERCPVTQDTIWMIQLAGSQDLAWIKIEYPVAAWVQHRGSRISRGRDPGDAALKNIVEHIQGAVASLADQDRLNDERRRAAAMSLWSNLQKGLRYDFGYWKEVARKADALYPGCRPPSKIHRTPFIKILPPLGIETALIPVRVAYHPVRKVLEKFNVGRI